MIIHDVAVTQDCQRMLCVGSLIASAEGLQPSKSRAEKQIIGTHNPFLFFSPCFWLNGPNSLQSGKKRHWKVRAGIIINDWFPHLVTVVGYPSFMMFAISRWLEMTLSRWSAMRTRWAKALMVSVSHYLYPTYRHLLNYGSWISLKSWRTTSTRKLGKLLVFRYGTHICQRFR